MNFRWSLELVFSFSFISVAILYSLPVLLILWQTLLFLHPDLKPNFHVLVFREYLASGARDPINVDCKVSEAAKRKVAQQPDRYCFVEAEVYLSLINIV